jgi:hypothetical protein
VRAARAFVFAGALPVVARVRELLAGLPRVALAFDVLGLEVVVVVVVSAMLVSAPLAMTLEKCSIRVR